MKAVITIEHLAERLGKKVWQKGDTKRIYIDSGYNTKKMSTKTYIYKIGDEFKVSCFIECPSQPWAWIKSQQEEVINSTMETIDNIVSQSALELVDFKIEERNGNDNNELAVFIKENPNEEPKWFSEESFYSNFGDYAETVFPEQLTGVAEKISKQNEEKRKARQEEPELVRISQKSTPKKQDAGKLTIIPEIGRLVNHATFGDGKITNVDKETIEVMFEEEIGLKKLILKYAALSYL